MQFPSQIGGFKLHGHHFLLLGGLHLLQLLLVVFHDPLGNLFCGIAVHLLGAEDADAVVGDFVGDFVGETNGLTEDSVKACVDSYFVGASNALTESSTQAGFGNDVGGLNSYEWNSLPESLS